jgi:hypothetical protein
MVIVDRAVGYESNVHHLYKCCDDEAAEKLQEFLADNFVYEHHGGPLPAQTAAFDSLDEFVESLSGFCEELDVSSIQSWLDTPGCISVDAQLGAANWSAGVELIIEINPLMA